MMEMDRTIPTTLHEALSMALVAMRAVTERGVRIDMAAWYLPPTFNGPCTVCMAGAIMLEGRASSWVWHLTPASFGSSWTRVFRALDFIRRGDIETAIHTFYKNGDAQVKILRNHTSFRLRKHFKAQRGQTKPYMRPYEDGPVKFMRVCWELTAELKKAGV